MSVVAKQSVKYGIVGYLSTLIGVFSTLFIYPNDLEFAGKLQFIMPTALLLLPLVTFGIVLANVRFFPKLSKTNDHYNLFKFSIIFMIRNFLIILTIFIVVAMIFPFIQKTKLWDMLSYVSITLFVLSITQLISRYLSIKKRIVVPNIFENIFPKLGMIVAFYSCLYVNQLVALYILVLFFVIALLGMILYLFKIDTIPTKTSLAFLKKDNFKKELFTYSYSTFFGTLGTVVALNIDTYMIGEFLGYKSITIYNTSFNLVKMITVPALGVYTISSPIVAGFIENNEWQSLKKLHQKSSLYLFILGAILFTGIAVGIDDLYLLMKNGIILSQGKIVVYIIGFALLFDLATGFNTYIIINSKYYQFNNILTVGLALLTILTNLVSIFILHLGIIGVAIATSFSMTTYNLIKVWFNYKKFKVHPFSFKYVHITNFIITGIAMGYYLPEIKSPIIGLFYKPLLVLLLFVIWNVFFKIISISELLPKKWKTKV